MDLIFNKILEYVNELAPIIFFKVDREGKILHMNRFAIEVCGNQSDESKIQDIILDFNSSFNLEKYARQESQNLLLSVTNTSKMPQSFLFSFKSAGEHILIMGHLDVREVVSLQRGLISTNQELSNVTRALQKKNVELKQAFQHIKKLQGILPICMYCHKIRNDQNAWDRMEAYISEHSDAEFSHSICPDGMEKHHPEEDEEEHG